MSSRSAYYTKRNAEAITFESRMPGSSSGAPMDWEGTFNGSSMSGITLEWWRKGGKRLLKPAP